MMAYHREKIQFIFTKKANKLSGIPQMEPIRAEFWLKAVPLASWSRRHCRKTGRASGVGSIPRSKMALSVIWTHASHEFVSNA
jgi:hypothetical protein